MIRNVYSCFFIPGIPVSVFFFLFPTSAKRSSGQFSPKLLYVSPEVISISAICTACTFVPAHFVNLLRNFSFPVEET